MIFEANSRSQGGWLMTEPWKLAMLAVLHVDMPDSYGNLRHHLLWAVPGNGGSLCGLALHKPHEEEHSFLGAPACAANLSNYFIYMSLLGLPVSYIALVSLQIFYWGIFFLHLLTCLILYTSFTCFNREPTRFIKRKQMSILHHLCQGLSTFIDMPDKIKRTSGDSHFKSPLNQPQATWATPVTELYPTLPKSD